MRRRDWVVLLLLATAAGCGRRHDPGTMNPVDLTPEQAAEARLVAAVDELGGRTNWEEQERGDPVVEVELHDRPLTDAQLKELVRQLRGRANYRHLDLSRTPQVTEDGLKELKELVHLRTLLLSGARVTDAVLPQLPDVESLDLSNTAVTDAGVGCLKERRRLVWVDLRETKVTAAAVSDLQSALPGCKIDH